MRRVEEEKLGSVWGCSRGRGGYLKPFPCQSPKISMVSVSTMALQQLEPNQMHVSTTNSPVVLLLILQKDTEN